MRDLWQDVRYGLRTLARSPGFTVVAVVTLTLGIGANTTVFSLVNALLFRDPPGLEAADRLVQIGRGQAPTFDNWSYPVYRDFRERADWFSGVAGFSGVGAVVGRGPSAEAVSAQLVSDNYFEVLGVRPVLGRGFRPDEASAEGVVAVVVLSHRLWQSRYNGDAAVLGATLPVNGRDFEIVGVAPAAFGGPDVFRRASDLWIPATMVAALYGPSAEGMLERRGSSWFWVVGRLADGVSADQARQATEALYARLDEEHPELAGQGVRMVEGVGLRPGEREQTATISRLLLGIVALVLLIACANLAGLGLVRGAGRRGEVGVRAALGASRARVVRQMLTESLLVGLAGGLAAFLLTALVAGELPRLVPYAVSVPFDPDLKVFLFGLGIALGAGVLFGLLPSWTASRADLREALSGDTRGSTPRARVRTALVAVQLALSFVLVAGTGLLLRSLWRAQVLDPGFDADRIGVLSVNADRRSGYDEARGRVFFDGLREEAASVPGAEAVGLVGELPVADFHSNHTPRPRGYEPGSAAGPPPLPVFFNHADAGYFAAMGMELVRGRTFEAWDHGTDAEPVAVVNETLARRFFGQDDPVGRLLPFDARPRSGARRVIGVVADHRNHSLRNAPRAEYWVPFGRHYRGDMSLVVRARGRPEAMLPLLAERVERVDPGMPVLRAATLRQLVGGTLRETRMVSALIAIFGGVALVLAAVGLYGVTSYTVARRTREFGVRIAMGATGSALLGMVLRQGIYVGLMGLALGAGLALVALRLLRGLLFGVSPADPVSMAGGAMLLLAVALLAALVPAVRAAKVEPVRALTRE